MIGIIVELILSWLLLWFLQKKHLSVLGFRPTKSRIINLAAGLFLAAFSCTIYHVMTTVFAENSWTLNKKLPLQTILASSL